MEEVNRREHETTEDSAERSLCEPLFLLFSAVKKNEVIRNYKPGASPKLTKPRVEQKFFNQSFKQRQEYPCPRSEVVTPAL